MSHSRQVGSRSLVSESAVSFISSFPHLSIRARVLLVLASVVLISVGTVSGVAYRLGVTTLTEQALDQLTSVREMKGAQIESYFELIDSVG